MVVRQKDVGLGPSRYGMILFFYGVYMALGLGMCIIDGSGGQVKLSIRCSPYHRWIVFSTAFLVVYKRGLMLSI